MPVFRSSHCYADYMYLLGPKSDDDDDEYDDDDDDNNNNNNNNNNDNNWPTKEQQQLLLFSFKKIKVFQKRYWKKRAKRNRTA